MTKQSVKEVQLEAKRGNSTALQAYDDFLDKRGVWPYSVSASVMLVPLKPNSRARSINFVWVRTSSFLQHLSKPIDHVI
jgi:hypothetical protein